MPVLWRIARPPDVIEMGVRGDRRHQARPCDRGGQDGIRVVAGSITIA